MEKIQIKKEDKILILAPHPDDESIGAGGLLSMYPSQCSVWLLTDGCKGGKADVDMTEMATIRNNEFQKAMNSLGIVEWKIFGVEDRTLTDHLDLLLDEDISGFTKIFVPNKYDTHPDHRAAFQLLMAAIQKYISKNIEVYQYEVTAPFTLPTHLLDITDYIEKKRELISYYKSQLEQADYYEIALSLNKYRASVCEKTNKYYETFLLTDYTTGVDKDITDNLEIIRKCEKLDVLLDYYDRWIENEISGKAIEKKLVSAGGILIYGCGKLGKRLCETILKRNIHVEGFIDNYKIGSACGIDIYTPLSASETKRCSTVIVTAVYQYSYVKKELQNLGFTNVISFEELLK